MTTTSSSRSADQRVPMTAQLQEPLPPEHWHLNTDDTHLTLAVVDDRPAIFELRNPVRNWNWTGIHAEIPLIADVNVGGVRHRLRWAYQDALVDSSNGIKVTLRFTSSNPRLELKSTWWARPGAGPVEHRITIENKTGGDIEFLQRDVLAADTLFTADASVELWRFPRNGYIPTGQNYDPGVRRDILHQNVNLESATRNDSGWATDAWLPYHVLDVNAQHGLYLGYVWSFGRFCVSTADDPLAIRYAAYLWDAGSITIRSGKICTVPGLFIGTYVGDVDDGSNRMKRWFWNYKAPQSLRDHAEEPLVEYFVPVSEAELEAFFESYPVADWGGELAKIDIEWMTPTHAWYNEMHNCWAWNPHPAKWPNGMTAGDIAHRHRQKLALYFADTYQRCDLGTQEGRDQEKLALLTRFDQWHYDYYRSDFLCEGKYNYLMHEGYMEVLDYMIANRPGFRYEHCSGGGALKDFDTLQRISVMTAEDSAGALHHRKAVYSNFYAINPVQLKADLSMYFGQTGHAGDEVTHDQWRVPYLDTPEYVTYCLRTGFMGANMATNWGIYTQNQIAGVKAHWPLYTTRMRPILRGADVYHILPMADGINWDGMQYVNPSLDKGAVLLFKPSAGAPDAQTIKLKGLDRAETYRLTFQDRKNLNCSLTGAQLMDEGITVTGMTGDYASEIIWMELPSPGYFLKTKRQESI